MTYPKKHQLHHLNRALPNTSGKACFPKDKMLSKIFNFFLLRYSVFGLTLRTEKEAKSSHTFSAVCFSCSPTGWHRTEHSAKPIFRSDILLCHRAYADSSKSSQTPKLHLLVSNTQFEECSTSIRKDEVSTSCCLQVLSHWLNDKAFLLTRCSAVIKS